MVTKWDGNKIVSGNRKLKRNIDDSIISFDSDDSRSDLPQFYLFFFLILASVYIIRKYFTYDNLGQVRRIRISGAAVAEVELRDSSANAGKVADFGSDNSIDEEKPFLQHAESTSDKPLLENSKATVIYSIYDPADDDMNVVELRQQTNEGKWEDIRDFMQHSKNCSTEARGFYYEIILDEIEKRWKRDSVTTQQLFPVLDIWIKMEPDSEDCLILRGNAFIRWARHINNDETVAAFVRKEGFWHYSELARVELDHAQQLNPTDALICALHLSYECTKEEKTTTKIEILLNSLAKSNDPLNLSAHQAALQYYSAKCHGSHAEMLEFARSVTNKIPSGHPLWILILKAHFECYLPLLQRLQRIRSRHGTDAVEACTALMAVVKYWRNTDVRNEILHSYNQYIGSSKYRHLDLPIGKSITHTARNWYAYCLKETGDLHLARKECMMIGPYASEWPWRYFGKPEHQYQLHCGKLGIRF